MEDIEPIATYGTVLPDDVRATLKGLATGQRYASADLYRRYSGIVGAAGRAPGHHVAFGQALARVGMRRVKMTVGGGGQGYRGQGRQISAWLIT